MLDLKRSCFGNIEEYRKGSSICKNCPDKKECREIIYEKKDKLKE